MQAWRRALFVHGVAASVEHRVVLNLLGDVRTVVDIGANRGQFALAARYCFPRAVIHSFEPLRGPAEQFRKLFTADGCIHLYESAVGETSGEALIHISARDDSSSLLEIGNEQARLFPGTQELRIDKVRIGRLEEFLETCSWNEPALLKVDVQGYELHALRGCESELQSFDWIYVECSFLELYSEQAFADQVIAWLRERNFIFVGCYNMTFESRGRAVQADFLFQKKEIAR